MGFPNRYVFVMPGVSAGSLEEEEDGDMVDGRMIGRNQRVLDPPKYVLRFDSHCLEFRRRVQLPHTAKIKSSEKSEMQRVSRILRIPLGNQDAEQATTEQCQEKRDRAQIH